MNESHQPRVAALSAAAPDVDAHTRAAVLEAAGPALHDAGGVLLATCHRVEWYGEGPPPVPMAEMRRLSGVDAARHVIRLALGLGSAVLAEDQVLHQLRTAVADARRRQPLASDLSMLLDHAMRAGRTGRSWRPRMATSLADRALSIMEAIDGPLHGRRLLVIGAGAMGGLVARAGHARGAHITVASRTATHAEALAAQLDGATTTSFQPDPDILRMTDAVVVAVGGRWPLDAAAQAALEARAVVVDLSMPPAVDPALLAALGERGLDIDSLHRADGGNIQERRYRERLEALAATTLDAYLEALASRRRSRAERLASRVERQRAEAVAAYLRERPDLDAATRAELDRLTRDLSARLFREPLARLAADPDGRRGRALDELFDA